MWAVDDRFAGGHALGVIMSFDDGNPVKSISTPISSGYLLWMLSATDRISARLLNLLVSILAMIWMEESAPSSRRRISRTSSAVDEAGGDEVKAQFHAEEDVASGPAGLRRAWTGGCPAH